MMSIERDWTLSQYKKYLTRVDFYQRFNVEKEAQVLTYQKTNAFVKQYVKTRLEAAHKDRDKYAIISRFDSEKYRRWFWNVSKVAPQPRAESYINQIY